MRIELNDSAICDEILALTALRNSGRRDNGEETALLTRDCLPGLRNMVRMMFAETVVELHGYVRECGLDDADPAPNLPYGGESGMRLGGAYNGSGTAGGDVIGYKTHSGASGGGKSA